MKATQRTTLLGCIKSSVLKQIIVLALIPGLSGAVGYNSSAKYSPNATTNTIFDAQQSGGFIPGKVEAAPTSFYTAGFLVAYNVYITLTGAQALFTAIAISGKLLTTLNNPHAITEINGKFGEFVEDIDLQKLKKLGYSLPQNVTNKILEDRPSWWNRPLSTAIANANKQNNATVDIYAYVFYLSTLPETQLVSKVDFIPEVKTKVGAVCAGLIKEDSSYIDICKNIITSPVFDLYLQFINELRIQNSIASQTCVIDNSEKALNLATKVLQLGQSIRKQDLAGVPEDLVGALTDIASILSDKLDTPLTSSLDSKVSNAAVVHDNDTQALLSIDASTTNATITEADWQKLNNAISVAEKYDDGSEDGKITERTWLLITLLIVSISAVGNILYQQLLRFSPLLQQIQGLQQLIQRRQQVQQLIQQTEIEQERILREIARLQYEDEVRAEQIHQLQLLRQQQAAASGDC